MRLVAPIAVLLATVTIGHAEIPSWYERDIPSHIEGADSVVLYRIEKISVSLRGERHHVYRMETTTLEVLKGSAAQDACYFVETEGEWDHAEKPGDVRLAILNEPHGNGCRLIEPLYTAPGTDEYIKLFRTFIKS